MGWVIDWWTHCVYDSAWLKRTISKTINLSIVAFAIRPEKFIVIEFKKKSELINKWSLEAEPETHWFSKWVVGMAKYRHFVFFTNMDELTNFTFFWRGGGVYEYRPTKWSLLITKWHMRLSHLPGLPVDSGDHGDLKVIDRYTPCD